ncbi:DUF4214 domain-containing protein [Rhodoferax antarcticus]|uniref:DUF4214 domain-containing protein n=1 Tax=Rhodoferax antarcticus TaxID=81479 RepID=UPI002224A41F|nr:DUF4214 domain-containing protein [Rhodoferax antarcticus]MCW2313989.1 hypothetical protein [Rhodoferax antarcticus]
MALTKSQIQNAYVAFFNRPADVAGLNYWSSYAGNAADLLITFALSAEYTNLYTGLNNTQVVDKIYNNLFGRGSDVAGLNYWVGELASGKIKIGNIADAINKGAQGTDATAVANKTTAATAFTNALDTAPEVIAYSAIDATGLGAVKTWLSAVTTDATLTTATSAAGLTAITATVVSSIVVAGQTFRLTTGLDIVTGTAGNDTIIGNFTADATNSVQAGDQINGGAGTDTLKLFSAYTAANMPIAITGVEVINFVNPGSNAVINTTAYSGVTKVQIDQVTGTGTFALTTGAGQAVQLTTAGNTGSGGLVTLTGSATDVAQTVTLAGFQGATGATVAAVTLTGAANTTLNIVSNTAANAVSTLTTAATTTSVVVTGDKALTIAALTGAAIKTVDASAATAAVVVNVDAANATLSFKGGAGNDTVTFGATNTFTSADTVDGGAGVDTLEIQAAQAVATTKFTNITNVETLKVTNVTSAGDIINLDNFGVQNISFGAASTATTTVTNIASGATLSLAATGTTALTIKADGVADSLAIKIAGTSQTFTVNASQFENITVDSSAVTTAGTFAFTDAQLKSITVTNTTALGTNPDAALDLGTLGPVVSTVNLSAFKAATATNGVTVTLSTAAVNGATVTGSQNHDTIVGSSQADTIITGANGANITAGAGADTITLTASVAKSDLITLTAAADSNQTSYDKITGFTNSTTSTIADKIDFTGTGLVSADVAAGTATGTANLTAAITNGFVTFAGSAAATATLAQEILAATTLANGAQQNSGGAGAGVQNTIAFVFGGDTYVYSSGATNATTDDSMVQLVGLTSATALSSSASTATAIFIA